MEKITTYLCDRFAGIVKYEGYGGDIDAIEIADGTVKTSLWPEGSIPGCSNAGKIETQILKNGDNRYVCPNGDLLDWEQKEIMYGDSPVGIDDYITIEIQNPDHCHWIQSAIIAYGADGSVFGRLFAYASVGSGGQSCPEDKKDVFSGGGKSKFYLQQNVIVPGESIELRWAYWDSQHTEIIPVDAKWFCACCFTGGKVKSVNGDYGSVSITYTVEIQGVNRICVSSDFVEYAVDDWVFVLVPSSDCSECGRKTACKEGCEQSSDYMILPLRIGDYGP